MNDKKLGKYLILLLFFPLALGFCSQERFRYPCQDPTNWDKDMCKAPICDVTRTCPEQIFKGQRDPKTMGVTTIATPAPGAPVPGVCK